MSGSTLSRNSAGGVGAGIILWILIIAMLIFTSIRTVHILQLTFPPDQQYVAYLGLGAFDIGVLIWFFYATQKARGAAQRAVAYGMIFVCALGVILATIADFFYQANANGVVTLPPQLVTVAIWGVIIVICLNFLAGIIAHLVDPSHIQRMKEEQLHDQIIAAAHTHMDTMTAQIAPEIAEVLAIEWKNRVTAELIGKLPPSVRNAPALAPEQPQNVVQGSGHTLPEAKPAPAKKEAVLAQTTSSSSDQSWLPGLRDIFKGLVENVKQPQAASQPVPVPAPAKDTTRPFKDSSTPGQASSGLPKKELPKLRHSYASSRRRVRRTAPGGQDPYGADQAKN